MSGTVDPVWQCTDWAIDFIDTSQTAMRHEPVRTVYVRVMSLIIDTHYTVHETRDAPGHDAQEAYYMTNGYDIRASFLGYGYGGITMWTGIMEFLYYAEDIDYDRQSEYNDVDNFSDFEGYYMSSDIAPDAYHITNGDGIHANFLEYSHGSMTWWTGIIEFVYDVEGIEFSAMDYESQQEYDTDNYSDFEGYAMSC